MEPKVVCEDSTGERVHWYSAYVVEQISWRLHTLVLSNPYAEALGPKTVCVETPEVSQQFHLVVLSSDELQVRSISDSIPPRLNQVDRSCRQVARACYPKPCLDDTKRVPPHGEPLGRLVLC